MAVDTAEKRYSMMNMPQAGASVILFETDGTVDTDDRFHLLGLFSEVSAGGGPVALSGTCPATSGVGSATLTLFRTLDGACPATVAVGSAALELSPLALAGTCAATSGSSAALQGVTDVAERYISPTWNPPERARPRPRQDVMDYLGFGPRRRKR